MFPKAPWLQWKVVLLSCLSLGLRKEGKSEGGGGGKNTPSSHTTRFNWVCFSSSASRQLNKKVTERSYIPHHLLSVWVNKTFQQCWGWASGKIFLLLLLLLYFFSVIFKVKSSTHPPGLSSCFSCTPQQHWGLTEVETACDVGMGSLELWNCTSATLSSLQVPKNGCTANGWHGIGSPRDEHASLSVWGCTWASTLLPVVFGQSSLIDLWHSKSCPCAQAMDGWAVVGCCSVCRYK